MCGYGFAQDHNPPLKATLAAGTDRGYYTRVCEAIKEVASQENFEITCLPTQGSLENVYDLARGKADFALVQSDVAHRAWMAEAPFERPHPQIQIVAPLFTEKIHILVRPHQYLGSVSQLKGKKIWMGPANSGTRVSASSVLQAAGLSPDPAGTIVSLDERLAFALLGEKLLNKQVLLDAVIDSETPSPEALQQLLRPLGIKTVLLKLPQGPGHVTVLFRPDTVIPTFSDLVGKTVWASEGCCSDLAAGLAALGLANPPAEDVAAALKQLRHHEIDAVIQPELLTPAMLQAILDARGFTTLPVAPDPRTNGKTRLVAFLASKVSAVSELAGSSKKIWWPPGNDKLDDVVLQTLLPGDHPNLDDRARLMDRDISLEMAFKLLALGELDAVFDTTVATSSTIYDLMNSTEITLLGLDRVTVEKLVEDTDTSKNSSYVETSFQRASYPLSQGIYTVAVQTLLLAGPGAVGEKHQPEKVAALARLLFARQGAIEEAMSGKGKDVASGKPSTFRLILLGSPLKRQLHDPKRGIDRVHPVALRFLVQPGHLRRGTFWALCRLVFITLVLVGSVFLLQRKRWLNPRYGTAILFVFACLFLWGLAAIWLQTVEGDVTQEFSTLNAAASSFGKNVLSQLHLPISAPEPSTPGGQQVLQIFSWIGALLLGTFALPFLKQIWIGELLARVLGTRKTSEDDNDGGGTDALG